MQGQRFLAEYVLDWNPKQAAIRAGAPEKGAQAKAYTWLSHPEAQKYLAECRAAVKEKVMERFKLSSDRTQQLMADLAYFDLADFFNRDGSPKPVTELSEPAKRAVQGFKTSEAWVGRGKSRRKVVQIEYRLVNRVSAADMAAKVTGEYKADNEQRRSAHDMTDDEIRARIAVLWATANATDGDKTATPPTLLQ